MENTLLQITHNGMGHGDEALGNTLITNYLKLILQENTLPRFICFYNSGVKLVCEGSPVLDSLQAIEQKGVKLIACKTCLKHFDLEKSLQVGIAGTMIDIIGLQEIAEKVITL